jgi:hypothetical protein
LSGILGSHDDAQFIGIGFSFIDSHYFQSAQPYLNIYLVIRRYVWRKTTGRLGQQFEDGRLLCKFKRKELAQKISLSMPTLSRAIWALEHNGWLKQVTIDGEQTNRLMVGERLKNQTGQFSGEAFFAENVIEQAITAEKDYAAGESIIQPPIFKTKTQRDYRDACAAARKNVKLTNQDTLTKPSDSTLTKTDPGITRDTSLGITRDTSLGITRDTYLVSHVIPGNGLNSYSPNELTAPNIEVLIENKNKETTDVVYFGSNEPYTRVGPPFGFPYLAPAARGNDERKEKKEKREKRVDEVERSEEETSMSRPTPEQEREERERQARVRGGTPPVSFNRNTERGDDVGRQRSAMSNVEPRAKGKKNTKRDDTVSPEAEKLIPDPATVTAVPTMPWGLYTHFSKAVLNRWPDAVLAQHDGAALKWGKELLAKFQPDVLYEMIQVLVLDYEHIDGARVFFKFKGGPTPTFKQLYTNADLIASYAGKGISSNGAYVEDYRRRRGPPASSDKPLTNADLIEIELEKYRRRQAP